MPRKELNIREAIIGYCTTQPLAEVGELLSLCTTIVRARASMPAGGGGKAAPKTNTRPQRPSTATTATTGPREVPKPPVRQPTAEDQKALDDAKRAAAQGNASTGAGGTGTAPKPPRPPARPSRGPKKPAPPVTTGAAAASTAATDEPIIPADLPPQELDS